MKTKQNKLHLKNRLLFRFGQEMKQNFWPKDPTITLTTTQSTTLAFIMNRLAAAKPPRRQFMFLPPFQAYESY